MRNIWLENFVWEVLKVDLKRLKMHEALNHIEESVKIVLSDHSLFDHKSLLKLPNEEISRDLS